VIIGMIRAGLDPSSVPARNYQILILGSIEFLPLIPPSPPAYRQAGEGGDGAGEGD